jgi:ubiquinone/menaquinone biosynthesis C-methylase UbiE
MGYYPLKITAIDIQAERLAAARRLYPQIHFMIADATRMEFENDRFDLVFESTMFATLPADAERIAISAEMVRVCKPGGYLFLVDWRTPKLRDPHYKALTRGELRRLFAVGTTTSLVGICGGALVPPVGRFLSSHLSSLYFLAGRLFPFLVGQVVYVLRKREPEALAHE